MYRFIINDLKKWKTNPNRKPLILRGARQVGKTYIVKKFASETYENLAYFNFDFNPELTSIFERTKDPVRILEQLSLVSGSKITPEKTLIFFDEIQESPEALNSLKYFYELCPEYHIISAGSLLGVRLSKTSFPVGKVNFLDLFPMSFSEFLIADKYNYLVDYLKSLSDPKPLPKLSHSLLEEKLKVYLLVGGMPEAVSAWVNEKDFASVEKVHSEILASYEQDFSKHVSVSEANKISLIWNGVVSQLSKENKKFFYQVIKTGARAREYESALNWLKDAGLIRKVYNVSKPNLPLKAYEDLSSFKIYLFDVGLLSHMAGIDGKIILDGDRLFTEFKGSLTENYCLNALSAVSNSPLYYHTFNRYEIDFLLQESNSIFPIEIKSNRTSSHTSLTNYNEKYSPSLALRFSMNNLKLDGKILNLPLYLAEYYKNFL